LAKTIILPGGCFGIMVWWWDGGMVWWWDGLLDNLSGASGQKCPKRYLVQQDVMLQYNGIS
jgi:hypothetical protein